MIAAPPARVRVAYLIGTNLLVLIGSLRLNLLNSFVEPLSR